VDYPLYSKFNCIPLLSLSLLSSHPLSLSSIHGVQRQRAQALARSWTACMRSVLDGAHEVLDTGEQRSSRLVRTRSWTSPHGHRLMAGMHEVVDTGEQWSSRLVRTRSWMSPHGQSA